MTTKSYATLTIGKVNLMIQVFLDTNVIVDFLAEREDFYEDAAIIMSLGLNNKIKLHAASMSFATASYLLRANGIEVIKNLIANFCKTCKVDVIDADCVNYAAGSDFNDFEDAMQFRCAQKAKCNYIVTRNTKDFIASTIPALNPKEFIEQITR